MGRYTEPPFARGESYFNGGFIDTTDLTNIGGEILEAREYEFEDSIHNTGNAVRVRVVRNMSATPVTAKQLVKPTTTGTANADFIGRVNGISDAAGIRVYVADELLPAIGIPQYDLFYCIVEGPATVVTPAAGAAITIGQGVMSTTTGRATAQDLSGSTSALGNNVQNAIGYALRALTVGQTGADLFIDVYRW